MLVVTPIDLADTAIKIGLGALSGLAGYSVARLSFRKEPERLRIERRSHLLESVAEDVERFTQVALRQWAFTMNWIAFKPVGEQFDEESKAELAAIRAEMSSAAGRLISAESKLLLLGEIKAQTLLREYGESVRPFRDEALVSRRTLSEEKIKDVRTRILEKRLSLFTELGKAYNRIWSVDEKLVRRNSQD